ncbi:MAG: AAA family ATPase [Acidimicrobiales bacterium]
MEATFGDDGDLSISAVAQRIEDGISSVVLGKPAQVKLVAAALLAGEHILLNDLPGVGKTLLATAVSKVVGGSLGRIQGTPDLLPTDLTGASIYHQVDDRWVFRAGPVVANVALVDEVNRITPRTQSALLEAMAEGRVTVDGVSRPLPLPFLVVATMNPVGSMGTFPLVAAQLDRFGLCFGMGSVDRDTERRLLRGAGGPNAAQELRPVLPVDMLIAAQAAVADVHVSDALLDYVLDLCDGVRPTGHLSARAPRALLGTARAIAVLDRRSFVVPDDIKLLAVPSLAHRLAGEGQPVDTYCPQVRSVVEDLPVPNVSLR